MKLAAVLGDPVYDTLKRYIVEHTALHYYAEKDEDLAARIARRMAARGATSCSAYMSLLRGDVGAESEWDALVGEITIGETYFFRQCEHFDLLRTTVFPEILRRNAVTRTMHIWSAGCATGAEPYSIALLLHRHFAGELEGWDVRILATDINVQFLAQARTGRYGEWALRQTPESVRQCCFRKSGPMWELLPEYRRYVEFRHHNLASGSPCPDNNGTPIDLIMCRNVMIYFSEQRIQELARRFHDCLAPGGWLLVGHAEPSMLNFSQFEVFTDAATTAYRKAQLGDPPRAVRQPDFNSWPFVPEPSAPPPVSRAPRRPPVPPPAREQAPPPSAAAAESRLDRARALADQGHWAEAADICRRLIAGDPLNAPAHFLLGLVAEHHGTPAEAEASFRKAVYLDRQFALAHYHLGLTLHKAGNRAQERKHFANTIELLRDVQSDEPLPHGDGIRAAELRELAQLHLEGNE